MTTLQQGRNLLLALEHCKAAFKGIAIQQFYCCRILRSPVGNARLHACHARRAVFPYDCLQRGSIGRIASRSPQPIDLLDDLTIVQDKVTLSSPNRPLGLLKLVMNTAYQSIAVIGGWFGWAGEGPVVGGRSQ